MSTTQIERSPITVNSQSQSTISVKASPSPIASIPVGALSSDSPIVPHTDGIELVELGSSRDTTTKGAPGPGPVFPAVTAEMRRKANIQFAALCWTLFLGGWSSGATGPLLPRVQEVYKIGFTVVSLLFVFNCVVIVNVYLSDKVGFGWVVVIGAAVQVAGYAVSVPAPPYAILVLSYFITGFGVALQDASASAFVAALNISGATRMGIMHSIYGFGAFCAPLAATQFALMPRWAFFFLISLGITIPNIVTLAMVFKFKRQHELLTEIGQPPAEAATHTKDTANVYRSMMKQKSLHILTLFMFVYLGAVITIGGWIVTFLINERGGGPSAGYVSSGLYGGITVGRILLIWVNRKIGERRAVLIYMLTALGLQFIVWFVPSLVGNALAVSFAGVFLGPIYPVVMNQAGRILPPRLLTGCVSWIGGFGQAGSAFMPFVTGALASSKGIQSIQPLIVAMLGLMVVLWLFVPDADRRDD
ncbi:MFS general substrate transporter [Cristinia sonorae]|uniref:MFS general substrate transporter n=1 Tax=Cristinia sonorae TaxID=1940300 RepID=A0A8K0USH9_9AGAR|nr:MFS general substrate transporter [Cristinia sonorae]